MVFFAAMALLAPFLANHAFLDPTAEIGPPFAPPTLAYYHWFGTTEQGMSCSPSSLERPHLAGGRPVRDDPLDHSRGEHRHRRWLLRRLAGRDLHASHRHLSRHPLAAARHGAGRRLGPNYWIIVLIVGITCLPSTARIVRADVLRVRELQFIERGRAIGSSNGHIMQKHILPTSSR